MTPRDVALLVSASAGAGVMNAMAGGGTILTYPALLASGLTAVCANATSTVALLPGAAASLVGYRREVRSHRRFFALLLVPSLLGGAVGAVLLLATPDAAFERIVPFLILFATLLFWFGPGRASDSVGDPDSLLRRERLPAALAIQFAVGIYGGYFGAGIGILMLSTLAFLGFRDIHAMNGLKNFFGMCINALAAALFIVRGKVAWAPALLMAAGSIVGGYAGALLARRIGRTRVRFAVVVVGFVMFVVLLLRRGAL